MSVTFDPRTGQAQMAVTIPRPPVQIGQVLKASDAADNDLFGRAVALSADGTRLVAGASSWEGTAGTDRGGVYTFAWTGATWSQVGAVLEAADAADLHEFGASCAMSADGQRLVVGASGWHNVGATTSRTGGVYTFAWNGASWDQVGSVLIASDARTGNKYGVAVALSADGTRLVVGDYFWDDTAVPTRNYGGVYTYAWTGTAWSEIAAPFRPADNVASDSFGWSLVLSADGTRLVVGAAYWEGAVGTNRGGVYTFVWTGSGWSQVGSVLEASDAADSDRFGYSVALAQGGLVLVVGVPDWEGAVGTGRGGVYRYIWTGSGWSQVGSVLEASDAADSDNFGFSVALSADGTRLVVGSALWEGAVGTNYGGVYTYDVGLRIVGSLCVTGWSGQAYPAGAITFTPTLP